MSPFDPRTSAYDQDTMSKSFSSRRVAAFICLAVVFLIALTCSADGPPVPVLFFLAFFSLIAVPVFLLPYVEKQIHPQQVLAAPTFSPRPPPTL
jgi:hypothetical protein